MSALWIGVGAGAAYAAFRLWYDDLRRPLRPDEIEALHPGWADTPAVRSSLPRFHRVTKQILRTPAEGADTVVWLAASERGGDASGAFFFDREPRRTHLLPWTRESEAERRALWQLCEEHPGGAV